MINPELEIQEELTAYLDGELDAEACRRVEERLARDPEYRAELQRLERAWDLLDRLPRATVDDSFTRTTIEMVAVAAAEDVEALRAELPRRRRQRSLLIAAGIIGACLVGFLAGRWTWPSPNEQLLRDLPVIENLDQYHQAEDIEFLRLLDREGIFPQEPDDAG